LLGWIKELCQFMCGIHLNNNSIANSDYFHEVLSLFSISKEDVIACNRSKEEDCKAESHNRHHIIHYDKYLKPYYSILPPDPKTKGRENSRAHGMFLKKHKDHIVLGK